MVEFSARLPTLTVFGIAGPGDPLANPEQTFRTLRLVKHAFPDVHLCLSTNGLMLPEYIDEIHELGIKHVTVTLNAVDEHIGKQLYGYVRYKGKMYYGKEAAALLLQQQLRGIKQLTANGVLCKVNSVLVPQINGRHLPEVTAVIKELGAFSHNIMPLILSPGSKFEKEGIKPPSPGEVVQVQQASARIMPVMRHCRQCRADAVGLLGADLSQTPDMLPPKEGLDAEKRMELRERLVSQIQERTAPQGEVLEHAVRVAVATRGSNVINQHFGHAKEFVIYDVAGETIRLVGVRKVQAYCNGTADCRSKGGHNPLADTLEMLQDCRLLLCSGIGKAPSLKLMQAGIVPLIRKGPIDEQLLENVRYLSYFAPNH
jgi:nitrogen fixation protein NifB